MANQAKSGDTAVVESLIIRRMLPSEYYLMEYVMYEAVYNPDPMNPYPKEIVYLPEVRVYWDNWGCGEDDYCLVAEIDGQIIGTVWIRIFSGETKGYGYVDSQTPEIAIALLKEYRSRGVGTELMRCMIRYMRNQNYGQVSLSITKGNPAIRLYERLGFKTIDETGEDYIMLLKIT